MPALPELVRVFYQILDESAASLEARTLQLHQLEQKYPQFFTQILEILNADHLNLSIRIQSLQQVLELGSGQRVFRLLVMLVIYLSFSQYKINGIELQQFWQDCLRRAVCARMIGEKIGLDASRCFYAGFLQDIGFLLLFFQQPEMGALWREFRKREPEARLQMELNTFRHSHDEMLLAFLQNWNLEEDLADALKLHHQCDTQLLEGQQLHLCQVLHCADWLSAVYSAEDKSFVINRSRKLLSEVFQMEPYRAEELLEAIPDDVDQTATVLNMDVGRHPVFSQILYQANIHLNEANVNFQELTYQLEQALDERDKLAAEINRDLSLAREIQQSLLPLNYGDDFPISGINISARILSGDFYDFFELANGDIYFTLGDVSGKGVNAALLMAKTSSLFRCLGKRIDKPDELLYEINNELCETSIHGMFVTMVAGRYSPESGEIHLVNAGNPPALLMMESGLCREFEASSPPLGVLPDTVYTEYCFMLNDDSLYIYSDGVTESYMNDNSMLEISGLFRMIESMGKQLTPAERLHKIVEQLSQYNQVLRDDITLLLLEKPGLH